MKCSKSLIVTIIGLVIVGGYLWRHRWDERSRAPVMRVLPEQSYPLSGFWALVMKKSVVPFVIVAILAAAYTFYVRSEQQKEHQIVRVNCSNNLKQIATALRVWGGDHDNKFPWNVSTNTGGTKELVRLDKDGIDTNSWVHFRVMADELETPKSLVCPNELLRRPAADFTQLGASNVTYRLHIVPDMTPGNTNGANIALIICPLDRSILYYDGHVKGTEPQSGPNGFKPMPVPGQ